MQKIIDNYANGNLTDAKRLARRKTWHTIFYALREHGHSTDAAMAIADYLKGLGTLQDAANAEHEEKQSRTR